jgi:hypothetical protein
MKGEASKLLALEGSVSRLLFTKEGTTNAYESLRSNPGSCGKIDCGTATKFGGHPKRREAGSVSL